MANQRIADLDTNRAGKPILDGNPGLDRGLWSLAETLREIALSSQQRDFQTDNREDRSG